MIPEEKDIIRNAKRLLDSCERDEMKSDIRHDCGARLLCADVPETAGALGSRGATCRRGRGEKASIRL